MQKIKLLLVVFLFTFCSVVFANKQFAAEVDKKFQNYKKEPKVEPIIKQESKQDKLIEVFQKHFPQALQETEQGFLVDKEQLQRALEPKNCEVTDEALELRWVGKKEAYHSGYSLTDKIIQPLKEQSKDFENTGNVLIKGDNLDALKLLQKNYFER